MWRSWLIYGLANFVTVISCNFIFTFTNTPPTPTQVLLILILFMTQSARPTASLMRKFCLQARRVPGK